MSDITEYTTRKVKRVSIHFDNKNYSGKIDGLTDLILETCGVIVSKSREVPH